MLTTMTNGGKQRKLIRWTEWIKRPEKRRYIGKNRTRELEHEQDWSNRVKTKYNEVMEKTPGQQEDKTTY